MSVPRGDDEPGELGVGGEQRVRAPGEREPLVERELAARQVGELLGLDARVAVELRDQLDEVFGGQAAAGAVGDRAAGGQQPHARPGRLGGRWAGGLAPAPGAAPTPSGAAGARLTASSARQLARGAVSAAADDLRADHVGLRRAAVRARQPVGQTADRLIRRLVIEGHQRRRTAIRVEDVGSPAFGGEPGDLDAIVSSRRCVARSDARWWSRAVTLAETSRYSSDRVGAHQANKETKIGAHGRDHDGSTPKRRVEFFVVHVPQQRFHRTSTRFPQRGRARTVAPLVSPVAGCAIRVIWIRLAMTRAAHSPPAAARRASPCCAERRRRPRAGGAQVASTGAADRCRTIGAFRVFLKDGTALASVGEIARVGDRVVFSLPLSAIAPAAGEPGGDARSTGRAPSATPRRCAPRATPPRAARRTSRR